MRVTANRADITDSWFKTVTNGTFPEELQSVTVTKNNDFNVTLAFDSGQCEYVKYFILLDLIYTYDFSYSFSLKLSKNK